MTPKKANVQVAKKKNRKSKGVTPRGNVSLLISGEGLHKTTHATLTRGERI